MTSARLGMPPRDAKPLVLRNYGAGRAALSLGLASALLIGALMLDRDGGRSAVRPSRWLVTPPAGSTFDPSGYSLALSPDGTQLAFIASSAAGDNALWVRPLDSLVPRKLADGAAQPFWSADSRAIAFDGGGQFKKVDVATGLIDLGSKNGSFVRNARIDAPTRLRHGDAVRFGLFTFEFRLDQSAGSTETA